MDYSANFRKKVLESLTRGLSVRRAAELFGIHFMTIQNWKTAADRPKVPQIRRPRKISKEALLADVEAHPTDYLHERAKRFNCTPTAVHKAMRRYRISQKNGTETSEGLPGQTRSLSAFPGLLPQAQPAFGVPRRMWHAQRLDQAIRLCPHRATLL